jgi:hypothetical protein
MEKNIKVIITLVRRKDMEYILFLMEEFTKAIGNKVSSMVKEK